MIWLGKFIPSIVGAVLGFVIRYTFDKFAQKRKFKQELQDNERIDVSGRWYAAWQTSIDGEPLLNTEEVEMQQKGKTLRIWNRERSPENPKGGYFWKAQMQFFQGRTVMGWFAASPEENNASKGIMYFCYLSQRKTFYGQWVGSAYDGELVSGFAVIATDRARARSELTQFISCHPQDVRLVSYEGLTRKVAS